MSSPAAEIYGGLANTWDYGPLGVELKNNVKKAWWKKFVQENPYNVGLDAAILMNPQVWVASGHVGGFSDPLMDCKECKERFRADKVIEDWCQENSFELGHSVDAMSQAEMKAFIEEHNIRCPTCGKYNFTDIRQFNLMFKTFQGVTEDAKNTVYLRPETAQGIFVNFQNVQRTTRRKLPFGVCQIGKSFRNEITPGNFTFRTREFEQMELEFFCKPGTDLEWFAYWKQLLPRLAAGPGHEGGEPAPAGPRARGAVPTTPRPPPTSSSSSPSAGASCGAWPTAPTTTSTAAPEHLRQGSDLLRPGERTSTISPMSSSPPWAPTGSPWPSWCDAYDEEVVDAEKNDVRTVLRLHPALAPFKCAVLPLSKKLSDKAPGDPRRAVQGLHGGL